MLSHPLDCAAPLTPIERQVAAAVLGFDDPACQRFLDELNRPLPANVHLSLAAFRARLRLLLYEPTPDAAAH